MLCPYEIERQRNIQANQEVLIQLGLGTSEPPPARQSRKKQKRSDLIQEPARKSPRQMQLLDAGPRTTASKPQRADIPPWEAEVFRKCESDAAAASSASRFSLWDASKFHQHLTRSESGRSIATTGVAGYGAGLAKRTASAPAGGAVRAVRFGVGGFAVGLVRAAMKPPFKSLGRSEHAIAIYHSDGQLEGGGKAPRAFGPGYAQGDLVQVELRPSASVGRGKHSSAQKVDAVFLINGVEVGVGASAVARDGVLLAVQPYMGGVALLE